MKNQKGFSLIELLVVVIIIAIIAAIAIPSLLASRRAANQSATVANLRTIVSAGATYASLNNGLYPTDYDDLSTAPANYLDQSWAGTSVTKNGYTFAFEASATAGAGYCVEAAAAAGAGDNSYSVSHQGVIYDVNTPATPPACAAATGVISTGAPVGN